MLIASSVEVGDGVGVGSTATGIGASVSPEHPAKVRVPRVTSSKDVGLVIILSKSISTSP
jgi:hypothetical protein